MNIDLNSLRAKKARLSRILNKRLATLVYLIFVLTLTGGVLIVTTNHNHYGYLLIALAICCFMLASWIKFDLLVLPTDISSFNGRLSRELLSMLNKSDNNPQLVWHSLSHHWQSLFLTNRLLLSGATIESVLSNQPQDLNNVNLLAMSLADDNDSKIIEIGFMVAALIISSKEANNLLTLNKLTTEDVKSINSWLARSLVSLNHKQGNLGGIGRDWAFGFTNFLNHFTHNISQEIIDHKLNFGWLTSSEEVINIESALVNNTSALAIIGPPGIGKTSRIYALAQRMIEGKTQNKIAYHQVLQLDATAIIANASRFNGLENMFTRMIGEAANAGHVILFLDDAELFFNQGVGSINISGILQPIIQNKAIQIIMTLTPESFQRLKTRDLNFTNLITPIILKELPQKSVMNIVEDSALNIESINGCLISYPAIKTAYRLSDRFNSEDAFPGKTIKLLEQSITYAENKIITSVSVEKTVEQTRGVKVTIANQDEAKVLLHLEDLIHQRMINQSEAVKAVSEALRRARSGVGNPKRPIGSFLFLGPTGVGKTELAKAVAATYFGNVDNIVRLDMSEYQQEADVSRLLAPGSNDSISFIMAIRQQPFSVVLLDEIEKAHPAILNLLLQLLDEGRLTDENGRTASFKDAVIIATSNAGAKEIQAYITGGGQIKDYQAELVDLLIKNNTFKVELLNRFDEIVLFRPLNNQELAQVVVLLLAEINANISSQGISVKLSDAAINKIVNLGSDARYGARPMRRALQKGVENSIATKILNNQVSPGQTVILDDADIDLKA